MRRHLLVLLPQAAVAPLTPLLAAWAAAGIVADLRVWSGEVPSLADEVARHGGTLDAALLIGPSRRSPATLLPGPFAPDRAGRRVPLASLPFRGEAPLARFAAAAARIHLRALAAPAISPAAALLAQWMPHYLRLAQRMEVLLRAGGAAAYRWSGEVLGREAMLGAVGAGGLGLALYVGHGRPIGWVGYHGVRAHHFGSVAEPLGAMVSLCCRTASRRRTGLSYAEALPLAGAAGASFGAVSDTLHTDNTRWAVGMCAALAAGADTLATLVLAAAPQAPGAIAAYRITGDPLIPIRSSMAAITQADGVRTFA